MIARQRVYGQQLVTYLNALVVRGHNVFYATGTNRQGNISDLLFYSFPATVRKYYNLLIISLFFFYVIGTASFLVTRHYPRYTRSILSSRAINALDEMYSSKKIFSRPASESVKMFGFYIANNTGIGLRTFAGGLFAGIGSLLIISYNGLVLGASVGYMFSGSNWKNFFTFVCGHSSVELTAVVISCMAGLLFGRAILFRGRYSLRESLRKIRVDVLTLVYGLIIMFILAAAIEAFWSAGSQDAVIKYFISGILWIITISYFILMGRQRSVRKTER